jgi:hypothetical protein
MNMDCFKLIGTAPSGSVTALKKQIEFATRPADEFYGIRYYDVASPILETLYNLLPQEIHKDFYSSLLVINDNIPAHTDIVETAGFNCYVNPGDYYTNFYINELAIKGTEYADHGNGHIYDSALLTQIGSFRANPYEIYLINNKVIHEVITPTVDKPKREVLQLATKKYSFNEMCQIINRLQN